MFVTRTRVLAVALALTIGALFVNAALVLPLWLVVLTAWDHLPVTPPESGMQP